MTSALTLMTPAGYRRLGDATFIPLITVNKTLQISGSVTKTRGAHNLKIGRRLDRASVPVVPERLAGRHFAFNTSLTDNGAGTGGNSIASFLLGYPSQVARAHTLFDPHYHTTEPNCLRPGRLARDVVADAEPRRPLRRLHAADRRGEQPVELRPVDAEDCSSPGRTACQKAPASRPTTRTSRRGSERPATLPSRMVVRGGYGTGVLPGQLHVAVAVEEPAVRQHLRRR